MTVKVDGWWHSGCLLSQYKNHRHNNYHHTAQQLLPPPHCHYHHHHTATTTTTTPPLPPPQQPLLPLPHRHNNHYHTATTTTTTTPPQEVVATDAIREVTTTRNFHLPFLSPLRLRTLLERHLTSKCLNLIGLQYDVMNHHPVLYWNLVGGAWDDDGDWGNIFVGVC